MCKHLFALVMLKIGTAAAAAAAAAPAGARGFGFVNERGAPRVGDVVVGACS